MAKYIVIKAFKMVTRKAFNVKLITEVKQSPEKTVICTLFFVSMSVSFCMFLVVNNNLLCHTY